MAEDATANSCQDGATSPLSAAGNQGDPHITIRGLSKTFGNACIYDNFDLDIPPRVGLCPFSDPTAAGNRP